MIELTVERAQAFMTLFDADYLVTADNGYFWLIFGGSVPVRKRTHWEYSGVGIYMFESPWDRFKAPQWTLFERESK